MHIPKEHCKTEHSSATGPQNEPVLLPGLPAHLALLCLSPLKPSLLYKVCKSWRRLIYSPDFPPFFALYAVLSHVSARPASSDPDSISARGRHSHSITLACLDPISATWRALPGPPLGPSILRRHPDIISWALPIQSVTASNKLALICASTNDFLPALHHPLVFDPSTARWARGPAFRAPRRWCVAGSARGSVYVASGVGAGYDADVARSIERWDPSSGDESWERLADYRDGRFCREGIEAVGYGGNKLCMVNAIGARSGKQGAVYDVVEDRWEEMPRGMLGGWNGPVSVDACDERAMYVVDRKEGSISAYDGVNDRWVGVVGGLERVKGAEKVAVRGGKMCVVSEEGREIVVVDVLARPPNVWVVEPPSGTEVVAVHVLPRMAISEDQRF
ncbi:F-box/kelch-repeat protein SKIP25 [Striga asiatica]|uniref:F-box/kelch-repeat protein SKIP25 n=1 Tax=Striga asiatica TaxID=4170 RepID=A0A5A7QJZ0_STRAF|nr:F-box/kelch-repeat protein SKIP25 [Striga asiatica]